MVWMKFDNISPPVVQAIVKNKNLGLIYINEILFKLKKQKNVLLNFVAFFIILFYSGFEFFFMDKNFTGSVCFQDFYRFYINILFY
jgi:hypothetical protein